MRFRTPVVLILLCCPVFLLSGCELNEADSEWQANGHQLEPGPETTGSITIGDIDADTPTSRIAKLRPLGDQIAKHLGWQPVQVKVRIARSVQEISRLMKDGQVDMFIDSSYPILLVAESAGAEVVLEAPVSNERTYHCLIIANAAGDINELGDLPGKTIAMQELYSTSGYLLPAAVIVDAGYKIQHTAGPVPPEAGSIGFFFSGDEENTLSMLRQGIVGAGALSSLDWEQLPIEVKSEFVVLATSPRVPRKLLSIRSDFDPALRTQLVDALLAINDEERQVMFDASGWSWQFMPLDEQSEAGISITRLMIEMTREVVVN